MIAMALVVALAGAPAAVVGTEVITIDEVDRATNGRAEALRSKIEAALESAAWRALDHRLVSGRQPPRPATAAEVEARRGEIPPSFPESAREEALRWVIGREHREQDEAAARNAARRDAGAWVQLPADGEGVAPLPAEHVVAGAGELRVRGAEVEAEGGVSLFRLRGELYRERRRRLQELIDARLLGQETRRSGATIEQLVDASTPTEEEIDAHLASAVAAGRARPDREGVRARLTSRARFDARAGVLERLREETNVEMYLEPPPRPRIDARDSGAPALGPAADLDRTIVVFGSWGDERSRAVHAAVDEVRETRPDLRVEMRSWIPVFDPAADEASRVVACVARDGAIGPVRAWLLERPPLALGASWLADENLEDLARVGAIEVEALRACAESPAARERVQSDADVARRLGFTQVPAMLVGGFPLSGVQSAATLQAVLDGGTPALD